MPGDQKLLTITAWLQFLNWDVFVIRLKQEETLASLIMAERGRTNQQIRPPTRLEFCRFDEEIGTHLN
jgi:hypothetical protein